MANDEGRVPLSGALHPVDGDALPHQDGRGGEQDALGRRLLHPPPHLALAAVAQRQPGNAGVPFLQNTPLKYYELKVNMKTLSLTVIDFKCEYSWNMSLWSLRNSTGSFLLLKMSALSTNGLNTYRQKLINSTWISYLYLYQSWVERSSSRRRALRIWSMGYSQFVFYTEYLEFFHFLLRIQVSLSSFTFSSLLNILIFLFLL